MTKYLTFLRICPSFDRQPAKHRNIVIWCKGFLALCHFFRIIFSLIQYVLYSTSIHLYIHTFILKHSYPFLHCCRFSGRDLHFFGVPIRFDSSRRITVQATPQSHPIRHCSISRIHKVRLDIIKVYCQAVFNTSDFRALEDERTLAG
jgi:hypothetical protein